MLRNLAIFQLETLSHTTRRVALANGGEAFPYSDLSVGRIEGLQRTIPALVSDGVTEGDNWYVVNLIDASNNMNRYVQTVAVLGATSADQARDWAFKNIGIFIGANDTWSTAITSAKALKTYLDRPSTSVAIIAIRQNDLDTIAAQITDKPVVWDGSRLTSHDASTLLHELVKHDDEVTMMDAMTPSDLPILMIEMGGEIAEYDALIVDYNRLDLLMQRLNTAMQKSSVGNVKPVNVTQSKPFKKNGVTNVAALFEMSDGQSVTIVFHSPDNTPAKLAPSDTLTSWKWMLNKRDISAAVSPKNGENVQMPDLAKRILTIVEKNSARFTRTNGNKAAQVQELTDTNTRIGQKQEALAGILAINKDLQKQIDDAGKQSITNAIDYSKYPVIATDDRYGDIIEVPTVYGEKVRVSMKQIKDDRRNVLTMFTQSGKQKDGKNDHGIHRDNLLVGDKKLSDIPQLENEMKEAGYTVAKTPRTQLQEIKLRNGGYFGFVRGEDGQPKNTGDFGLVWAIPPAEKQDEELEVDELSNLGMAKITSVGGENIYIEKDGKSYFSKVGNTEKYTVGEWDFSKPKEADPVPDAPEMQPEQAPVVSEPTPPVVQAEPAQPANEPPMTNPDRDYLQSIIDGKVDPLTVDMDAVIALAEKYDGDEEITPLLDQALEAINQAEQEAAKGI